MSAMFGETFWDFTIIGVSHWQYDANSVAKRNYTGKTEEWFLGQWNEQLKKKFHLEKDLQGVFIDSWSQQPWNLQDPDQQVAFQVCNHKAKWTCIFNYLTVYLYDNSCGISW